MKPIQQQGRLKKQFIHSAIIITPMEYHTDFHTSGDVKAGIFAQSVMVDQAHQSLCYQRETYHFCMLNIENVARSDLPQFYYLAKLCYHYAFPRSHRKWLCYFVPYGHGKLDLRFPHGWTEKCVWNGADSYSRNRRGEIGLFICRHIDLSKQLLPQINSCFQAVM